MASRWGKSSLTKLDELDPRLRGLVERVRDLVDITIVTGHRSPEEQLKKFDAGFSKVRVGKHNAWPSLAVDVQPYPVPAKEQDLREELAYIAGMFRAFGVAQNLEVRWGGDWNSNGHTRDNDFDDYYHIEIRNVT